MATIIRTKSDIFLKYLFGQACNEDLLIDFINSVFDDVGQTRVLSAKVQNPFNIKQCKNDKDSILDIKCETDKNEIINIEIKAPKVEGTEIVRKCIEAVKAHGLFDKLLISSFSPEILVEAKKEHKNAIGDTGYICPYVK